MTNTKVRNLLQGKTEKINFHQLLDLRKEYCKHIAENLFPIPPSGASIIDMLLYFKRKDSTKPIKIGPYEHITVFEAANRIASDLIIINGIIEIINTGLESRNSEITLNLGTTHIKGRGDFLIDNKNGEAFNVAPSYYSEKLRNTIKKWKNGGLSYILVNEDVARDRDIQRLQQKKGINLIAVANWQSIDIN